MKRLSDQILGQLMEIECSSCSYPFEVQILDARTQVFRHCPCCRQLIHLIDGGGSTYGALESVDNAVDELQRTLRRLFK
jgi:NAD-dependent SIR2 family protein deacetylase